MDGPTIARATEAALHGGVRVRDALRAVEAISNAGGRAVVMTYWNPVLRYGVDAFARDLAAAGGLGLITPDLIPDEARDWIAASDGTPPRPDLPGRAVVDPAATGRDGRRHRADSSTPRRRWGSPVPGTWCPMAPELVQRVQGALRHSGRSGARRAFT